MAILNRRIKISFQAVYLSHLLIQLVVLSNFLVFRNVNEPAVVCASVAFFLFRGISKGESDDGVRIVIPVENNLSIINENG